jgi:hypothetical protein
MSPGVSDGNAADAQGWRRDSAVEPGTGKTAANPDKAMKAGIHICPACGQSLYAVRFGVRMRPMWLHIVDAIVRAGPDGIMRKDLAAQIYREDTASPNAISVHINHINSALAATDYRIKGGTNKAYRIVTGATHD